MLIVYKLKFNTIKFNFAAISTFRMASLIEGSVNVKAKDLNLDLTLLGGQSFRWEKRINDHEHEWHGVAYNAYWILRQDKDSLYYKVYSSRDNCAQEKSNEKFFKEIIGRYLRLDFDLSTQLKLWRKSHPHFDKLAPHMKSVRVLDQEPLENIISFICSQNNNIKRISTMIQWLCRNYGHKIGNFDSTDIFSFPNLDSFGNIQNELDARLRTAKFGYRAKFIAQSIAKINELGGMAWFDKLHTLPYEEARHELVKLPGIGFKVADCICLMSLGHLESVPIDTHIFKIAQSVYMPKLSGVKAVTPKIYEEIAEHFRKTYGPFAGWAQTVLFCSELQQFQENSKDDKMFLPQSKKKREK